MDTVLNLFDFKQKVDYKTEILPGLTVALALVASKRRPSRLR